MKIKESYPPNFDEIKKKIPVGEGNIYTYGDTIYNPSGGEIPKDILFHETIHKRQQGARPDIWWVQYLTSKEFRLAQELEAYARQYQFVKDTYTNKGVKAILEELAHNLSLLYDLDITKVQAETLIRKYAIQK